MIRKKKRFSRPRKLYEKVRIEEENQLLKKYGLKSKHEVWKALAKVNYFRRRAMALAKAPLEEQEVLFNKLRELGLNIKATSDVLALNVEDLLKRRLPTVVFKKGLAQTVQQARQMVVHKNVFIGERIVNTPSYLVSLSEEEGVKVKPKKIRVPKEEAKEAEEVVIEQPKQ